MRNNTLKLIPDKMEMLFGSITMLESYGYAVLNSIALWYVIWGSFLTSLVPQLRQ